jgi:outer membrane immunogenic protein
MEIMRRLVLAAFVLAASAVSALAGDLPDFKSAPAPIAPPPPLGWTGAYVGVYGGGVFATTNSTGPIGDHYNQSPGGGAFGGLVGYNIQYRPNWVGGIEGEGGWQGYKTTTGFIDQVSGDSIRQTVDTNYSARIRGRLGYAFGDRALLFVAGGLAFSDISASQYDVTAGSGPYSRTRDFIGGTIGGGLDYAFMPNWIGRIEYIYDNYPGMNYGFSAMPPAPAGGVNTVFDRRISEQQSTVRAALIYKFDAAPAPVVAKY